MLLRGLSLLRFGPRATKRSEGDLPRFGQVEEKRRRLAQATQQWLVLLREMECNGETGDGRYETYYQAYLQARDYEKRADLELFNLRQGLST